VSIFTKKRELKRLLNKEGKNFVFIAKNITAIYNLIEKSNFGNKLKIEQKLFATAYIALYEHITEKKIRMIDIEACVKMAKRNAICIVSPTKKLSVGKKVWIGTDPPLKMG